MRITVWTLEFGGQNYFKLTDEINNAYCARHGYAFNVFRPTKLPVNRHPVWSKVRAVQHALNVQKRGVILFMDRDAYFHDHDRRIEELIARMSRTALYLFGSNRRDRRFTWGDAQLNSGVFLVRCTDTARDIALDWWRIPRVRENTRYRWPPEQAAMNYLRFLKPKRIQVIPYFHLNGADGEFIRHAAGTKKLEFLSAAFERFQANACNSPLH